MDTLKDTLIHVLEGYTGKGLNGYSYLVADQDKHVFIVVGVGHLKEKRFVDTDLIVRLEGQLIIIERDQNDKILLDALMQAGIPRSQIVLAYTGETVEESV